MKEIWKDIPQDTRYMVSSFWRVKRKAYIKLWKTGKIRYQKPDKVLSPVKWKYLRVSLNKNLYSVHRLVAQAFLWLDYNKKETYVCHKDDNTSNNNINNLFLWTPKDNSDDMVLKNRWKWNKKLSNYEVSEIKKLIGIKTHDELWKIYNVSRSCISMIACWKNFTTIT